MWRTGSSIARGALLLAAVSLATPAAHGGELLGTEVWTHTLMRIDRDTASWTAIGTFDVCTLSGLAYDENHDILYGIAPCTDNIYIIDRATGHATCVGPPGALGVDNANGLAYDPVHDILYATDNNTNTLLRVNTASGVATVVATISGGYSEIEGLGFDRETQVLYGLTQLQQRIVSIDVQTGWAAAVSEPLPSLVWRGLDFDSERHLLYASAVNIYGNAPLYRFDPVSGELAFVGNMVGASAVQGLGFVSESAAVNPIAVDPGARLGGPSVRCQSHPNPFTAATDIQFVLEAPACVTLQIFDASGRRVRRLANAFECAAGGWRLTWDGQDDAGRLLGTGAYFCRLTVGGTVVTQRLQLIR
jgi:hypothetical protein